MTREELDALLLSIEAADPEWLHHAQQRQSELTKPPGSLGLLEAVANRICAMQKTLTPSVDRATIVIFAADHGVCAEGVNAYPQAVTRQMVANFLAGGAAINAVAHGVDAALKIVDAGVIGETFDHPSLITRRIGNGTGNICAGAAMSTAQALEGIALGIDCAKQAVAEGANLLACGEMGIGNTTIASALCAALTKTDPQLICGRGTAVDDEGLGRKRDAVARALQLHSHHLASPIDLLSRLGGFEIAAICGFCIGAAHLRMPLLLDGFIATAAAAVTVALQPTIGDYLFAGHQSAEPGHVVLLEFLRLQPLLNLDMRLGEGTGAAAAIPLVRAAVSAFCNMATFESARVSQIAAT